jgi:hypothetical protein
MNTQQLQVIAASMQAVAAAAAGGWLVALQVQQPADLQIVQNAPAGERRTVIGINNAPPTVQAAMTRSDRFRELNDLAENSRLHMALMTNFNT